MEEESKQKMVKMERTVGTKKKSSDGLTVARAYRPPWSLLPEAVDESHNEPNFHLLSIHYPLGQFM